MTEPLVRIVSMKCQECGEECLMPERPVKLRLIPQFAQFRHVGGVPGCGGRVLIATEPVKQEAVEGELQQQAVGDKPQQEVGE